jgi:hypothetical protein
MAASGAFALATIAGLGYWQRPSIAALRADFRQRSATGPAGPADSADPAGPADAADAAVLAGAGARAGARVGMLSPGGPIPVLTQLAVPSPLGLGALPGAYVSLAPLPVYRATVESLGWDPSRPGRGRHEMTAPLTEEP